PLQRGCRLLPRLLHGLAGAPLDDELADVPRRPAEHRVPPREDARVLRDVGAALVKRVHGVRDDALGRLRDRRTALDGFTGRVPEDLADEIADSVAPFLFLGCGRRPALRRVRHRATSWSGRRLPPLVTPASEG